MKHIFFLLIIAALATTVNAQTITVVTTKEPTDLKYLLAKEGVQRYAKKIQTQIVNEGVSGTDTFTIAAETFLQRMDSALIEFKTAIAAPDTIVIDTVNLKIEIDSVSSLLAKSSENYSTEELIFSREYNRLKQRIAELEAIISSNQINVEDVSEWDYPVQYYDGTDGMHEQSVITYNGSEYKCIQSHISQSGWTPAIVPALWIKN